MSRISVIIPVYKVERYLKRCVDSILKQSFGDFDLILIDDGSPDKCPEMCDVYAKSDERVYVIHQMNAGLSAARNAGIEWALKNSDSQWITFVDSDDWVHENYLEFLYKAVTDTGLCISSCGYQVNDGTVEVENKCYELECDEVENFYCEAKYSSTIAVAKLYLKKCFVNMRYPVGKLYEDEFVTYKILFEHEAIAVVKNSLYMYFVREDSITNSLWTTRKLDVFAAIEEQLKFFKSFGYEKAHVRRIRAYVGTLALQMKDIEKSKCVQWKKYKRRLRYKLRRCILRFLKYIPFKEYKYVYEQAFPHVMEIYWIMRSIASRRRIT